MRHPPPHDGSCQLAAGGGHRSDLPLNSTCGGVGVGGVGGGGGVEFEPGAIGAPSPPVHALSANVVRRGQKDCRASWFPSPVPPLRLRRRE